MKRLTLAAILLSFGLQAQVNQSISKERQAELAKRAPDVVQTAIGKVSLPPPYATKPTAKGSKITDWPAGEKPKAPAGFKVETFADDLQHPRWTYIGENGDIFVVETNDRRKSANQITLLRDTNGDSKPDERHVFLKDLNQPFGMLILDGYFYVANVDEVIRFPYQKGANSISAKGEHVADLPAGGYNHHWTRNLLAGKDGKKIYVTVGSSSNIGEYGMDKEERRANIIEMNPDGSGEKVYAAGLRNPVGIDWNPITGELWTAVNERDNIGDNLVPDYVTSVQEGGWYGWPYSYYGSIEDPRWADDPHTEMVQKALVPDVPVGAHTASLGLAFYTEKAFPAKYHNGAFVGQHGSWNRANFAGYKILFIPFDKNGKPQQPEDFLTGFIASDDAAQVYGRPVGVTVMPDGSLLVNDDAGNKIWRVSAEK